VNIYGCFGWLVEQEEHSTLHCECCNVTDTRHEAKARARREKRFKVSIFEENHGIDVFGHSGAAQQSGRYSSNHRSRDRLVLEPGCQIGDYFDQI
jgi:hypothetical protein